MTENKETFNYTYSATQQKEIEMIRKKYLPENTSTETDTIEQLRLLDASVTKKATTVSLCIGIISVLIMGSGMSLIMTDIGKLLGFTNVMFLGIIVGVIGMIGVIVAYPIHQYITKKERKKIAPQILKLTEELLIK